MTMKFSGTGVEFPDGDTVSAAVGTVSQTGGIPTGAIIERGSNANGEFTKFADGTMLCWRNSISLACNTAVSNNFGTTSGTMYRDDTALTFPATFVGLPTVICSGAHLAYQIVTFSATGFTYRPIHTVSGAVQGAYLATGRWF